MTRNTNDPRRHGQPINVNQTTSSPFWGVFWALCAFFIGLPLLGMVGCTACTVAVGTAANMQEEREAEPTPTREPRTTTRSRTNDR